MTSADMRVRTVVCKLEDYRVHWHAPVPARIDRVSRTLPLHGKIGEKTTSTRSVTHCFVDSVHGLAYRAIRLPERFKVEGP